MGEANRRREIAAKRAAAIAAGEIVEEPVAVVEPATRPRRRPHPMTAMLMLAGASMQSPMERK